MTNCKYLKIKLNKTLQCKRKHKIINIKECTNCKYKEYKCTKINDNCAKIKKKTMSKLERNRKSVFTDNLDYCIICGNKKDHLHEIFFGNKRQKSMELGFVIPLCFQCHTEMHINKEWQDYWHKQGQLYFERNIGDREDFIRTFRKSYL